jgi:hypothetical protein
MRWRKRGVIFSAVGQYDWMLHHAAVPVADKIAENVIRIYFGCRDSQGRTRTGFIEAAADDPSHVLYVHDTPALDLGQLGTFDDSGAMPSCIVNYDGRKYLFYIGWNRTVTVPYRNAIGIAVSDDGDRVFRRLGAGPILDRTLQEPYFCASPFCLHEDGQWKLWYASATGWVEIEGRPEPLYQIKYAESADGLRWSRNHSACIPYTFDGEANARPYVMNDRGRYRMWYCFRGSSGYRTDKAQSYRIGYAESIDGLVWERKDGEVGIDRSVSGWDSVMMEYPWIYEHNGTKYMLYNGNGFGETGFGYATLEEDG